MTVVQNTATDPGGEPLAQIGIRIALVTGVADGPGYTASGDILGTFSTTTDLTGHWSATLAPNASITPANTYYQVVEGRSISNIVVPDSGGPYNLSQVLVTAPAAPGGVGITGVQVAANGTVAGARPEINLVAGANTTVTAADNPGAGRVDVTIAATGGGGGAVASVNGHTGTVVLAASDVNAIPTSAEGAASGVATLDTSGHLTGAQAANLLAAANALSELTPSAATARSNLGLGSAATQPSSAFDASGAAADALSAAQSFATAAVTTETTRAEAAEAARLASANNLSDVPSPATARGNLGLGTAATENVNTTAATITALGTQAAGGSGQVADAAHVHPATGVVLTGAAASTVQSGAAYGTAGAVGIDLTYAREDHQHGTVALTSSAPAVTEGIGQGAAVGSATTPARADHVHPLAAAATPGASAVGDAAATGAATTFAASDHKHGREAFAAPAAATTYGQSAATGSAATLAHSDHTHGTPALTTSVPATTLGIGTAAALGSAVLPALADHVHPLAAAATPTASAVGDSAATGNATTFAASNHVHGREGFGSTSPATAFGAASSNGSALTVARSDHVHGLPDAYTFDSPKQRGWAEWNYPPGIAVAVSQNFTTQVVYGISFIAQTNSPITKVGVQVVSSAGTPVAGQNLIGLYSVSGTTATQIAVTGDLGTWSAAGFQPYAFGAGQTLVAGTTYLLLFMSNATTPVHLQGITSDTAAQIGFLNLGLSNTAAPFFKFFVNGTGQTALPASFTIAAGTMSATNALAPWACLL